MSEILTNSNFDKLVLNAKGKVLVDFWAPWCGPCRMLSINLDEVALELNRQNILVCKVNVDDEIKLAEKFNINVIPALLVFKDGKLIKRKEGYMSGNEILELVR